MKRFLPVFAVGMLCLGACGLEKPPAKLEFPESKKKPQLRPKQPPLQQLPLRKLLPTRNLPLVKPFMNRKGATAATMPA